MKIHDILEYYTLNKYQNPNISNNNNPNPFMIKNLSHISLHLSKIKKKEKLKSFINTLSNISNNPISLKNNIIKSSDIKIKKINLCHFMLIVILRRIRINR